MQQRWATPQQVRTLLGANSFAFPVYADLARRLRLLIVDGRLTQGVRMPSERDFAAALGLSRSTVTAAYVALKEQGFLQARPGSGNFVAIPPSRADGQLGGPGNRQVAWPPERSEVISFAYAAGPAAPEMAGVFRTAAERLPGLLSAHGYYPDGLPELRVALADWFGQRGLPTSPDQLIVTAGALSALNVVARTVLAPGDRVLLESPSYPNAIKVLEQSARLVPYPLPPGGWESGDVELTLRQSAPRLSYLIPDFHNPSGAWMSEEARPEIAAALQRYRSLPVVDESLVELPLDGAPLRTPLASYLPSAITIGSASKAFWGGLRIGWIRAPHDLVRPLIETRALLDLGAAPFEQLVLAQLLDEGQEILAGHRERLRLGRDQLRQGLASALPDWTVSSPAGGLSLWVTLPEESSSRLAALAERHGLVLTAGPRFFVGGGGERQLRLPYTASPDVLREAVERLARLWSEVRGPGRGRVSTTSGLTA